MKAKTTTLLIFLALFLSNCGSSQVKENSAAKGDVNDEFFPEDKPKTPDNSRTAKVDNVKQNINQENIPDVSRGYASWYGKELQGKPTSNGEPFDMNKFTAAHRTFSMGSIVLIRNLENGKKKLVKINDRGPYVDGRIIDVSYAVARDLGFAQKGSARVEVELIEEGETLSVSKSQDDTEKNNSEIDKTDENSLNEAADNLKEEVEKVSEKGDFVFTDGSRPQNFTVRTGAFKNIHYAEKYREELEDKYNVNAFLGKKGKWHFVWVGDFESKEAAKKFYRKLKTDGLDVLNPGKVQ